MDGIQLRDEAVRDRIRAAEEFLDPCMTAVSRLISIANIMQPMLAHEATRRRSC
jgi:hypothetical protein